MVSTLTTKFATGTIVSTPGAIEVMQRTDTDPASLLSRRQQGDWGELDPQDAAANDLAVNDEGRLLSVCVLSDQARVWLITEADRSASTFLLPCEY
jgi:hypothetical protein